MRFEYNAKILDVTLTAGNKPTYNNILSGLLRKNKSLQILGVSDATAIPLSEAGKHICLVLHFKVCSQSWSPVWDQPI